MNVHIKLKSDVMDVDNRMTELNEIREWTNELVGWDYSLYRVKFHSSGEKLIAWFEHDDHAAMFALRWS